MKSPRASALAIRSVISWVFKDFGLVNVNVKSEIYSSLISVLKVKIFLYHSVTLASSSVCNEIILARYLACCITSVLAKSASSIYERMIEGTPELLIIPFLNNSISSVFNWTSWPERISNSIFFSPDLPIGINASLYAPTLEKMVWMEAKSLNEICLSLIPLAISCTLLTIFLLIPALRI